MPCFGDSEAFQNLIGSDKCVTRGGQEVYIYDVCSPKRALSLQGREIDLQSKTGAHHVRGDRTLNRYRDNCPIRVIIVRLVDRNPIESVH